MIRSMTGFGRSAGELEHETITAELSAVNHRFLDCSFRLPYAWAALEPSLRETVKRYVARGKVSITIRRDRGFTGRQPVRFDPEVARQYIESSRTLAELMASTEALSLDTLAQLEGVFYQEEELQDLDTVMAVLNGVLVSALEQFNTARSTEGSALARDIEERVAQMREALASIEARLPELSIEYETRLRARLSELNLDLGLSEDRIALEVALLADKSDVNEEVVRLKAHFDHVLELLATPDPVGRDLNFLSQEIQREVNTLGSKMRDIGVTRETLRMKSELEKLREQIQNIE